MKDEEEEGGECKEGKWVVFLYPVVGQMDG